MKYGLVEGQRQEAQPRLSAHCPSCNSALVAKCGERRVWHWAHCGTRNCDRWWETETEWHRAWKNHFPDSWQEAIHWADDGEKHIADVKTEHGWVIEIQHSYLQPEERRAREAFYGAMVWVVDGLRRKNDVPQFVRALNSLRVIQAKPLTLIVPSHECRILNEWAISTVPVYLDFGDVDSLKELLNFGAPVLWLVHPKGPKGAAFITPVFQANFIEWNRTGTPLMGMDCSKILGRARSRVLGELVMSQRRFRQRRRRRL